MPILEYRCESCKRNFEELVKHADENVVCPVCGGKAERVWSGCVYGATGQKPKHCSGHCATCDGCK